MRSDGSATQASAWCWSALFAVAAAWEIFLRADSRVVSFTTKLWLFPLVLVGFTTSGLVVGRLVAVGIRRRAEPARAHTIDHLVFVVAAAAVATFEYAFLVYHHAPGALVAWPLVTAVAAAGAFLCTRRAPAPLSPRAWSAVHRLATLTALVALPSLAGSVGRTDVATVLIKRQSAFGRILGHGLATFPPHLMPPLRAPARPPDTPTVRGLGRRNVILLSVDTLRRDALGVYGRGAASPDLDTFAGTAVVFEDAYTQSPNSAPSMATVMTGLYPFRHGVRYNRMALVTGAATLAEILSRAGYMTAGFVTNVNFSRVFRFDRGFTSFSYLPAALDADGLLLDSSDPQAVDAALAWVAASSSRPFFLWVHLMAPHSPYLPPADLRPDLSTRSGPWFNVWNVPRQEARVEHGRTFFDRGVYARLYAAEVASADRLCGRLLRGLADLRVLDDTHVIFFSDHGEAFGESDVFGHGRSLDPAETHVPLAWRLPGGVQAGTRIATTVQLADLFPTLLGLLGVSAPAALDGRNLSGIVLGDAAEDDGFAFTEARFLHSMGVRGLLYAVRTRQRTLWLDAGYRYAGEFDRARDPEERVHLGVRTGADDPLYARLVSLAAAAQTALATLGPRVAVDEVHEERLRALGYVE